MRDIKDRFYSKFTVSKSGCWDWNAVVRCNGYGAFRIKDKMVIAHRASYKIHKGEIPNGLLVCHSCDNRKCVNPDHLFLGTQKDNWQDRLRKKLKNRRTPFDKLQIKTIRELYRNGISLKHLSRYFNVEPVRIYDTINKYR